MRHAIALRTLVAIEEPAVRRVECSLFDRGQRICAMNTALRARYLTAPP